jgi:hypothetical protein
VIIAVDAKTTEKDQVRLIAQLRGSGDGLTAEVLPDHRIIFASTVAGRVAFVRQMQRIELVLDFDPEVKTLLSRFGHKVVVYGQNVGWSASGSRLGEDLLPN